MKTCSKCGVERPLYDFHKHPKTKDRLRPDCKACCSTAAVKYRQENMEAVKGRKKKYYEKNKEKVKEQHRE